MEVVQLAYQIPVVILTRSVMLAPVYVIQDTMITMAPVAIMLEHVHQVSINLTVLHRLSSKKAVFDIGIKVRPNYP